MTSTGSLPSLAEYLAAAGVQVAAVEAGTPGAPVISMPVPEGWQEVPAAAFPGAYGVWATAPEGGWADNAVLLLGKLSETVNAVELLECGFTDARRLPEWRDIDTDSGEFAGYPSSAITGTYVVEPLTLWAYNRYIVVGVGAEQYLVQLTVTTKQEHDGGDAAAIVNGLTISA
ncbi:LpqN/LpqT family lipoprotein [Nocardia sp. IFM 10818]